MNKMEKNEKHEFSVCFKQGMLKTKISTKAKETCLSDLGLNKPINKIRQTNKSSCMDKINNRWDTCYTKCTTEMDMDDFALVSMNKSTKKTLE